MKKLRKNDGAALVAVLIGVLFITILASSLLYMSTLNYQMKSMRYSSTDNFYTAEFALEDMLAQIRQKTEYMSTTTTSTNTYDALVALLDGGIKNGHKVFNEKNLRNLIHISGYDADNARLKDTAGNEIPIIVDGIKGIKVSTIYREAHENDNAYYDYGAYTYDTFEKTGSSIILHGVKITVTTDEAHGNYESSLSLDLEFAFPEYTTSTSGSISDFSILSDTPIYVKDGNHVFTGSIYCRKNGNETIGANTAFLVGSNAVATMVSPFVFTQGDLVVEGGGTLFITGNCYVNGNIKTSATSTIFVTGDLKVRGSIQNADKIRHTGTITPNDTTTAWEFYDTNFGSGLAKKLATDYVHFFANDSSTNGISGFEGKQNDVKLTPAQFKDFSGTDAVSDMVSSGTVDGKSVKAILSRASTNNTANYDNALVVGFSNVSIHAQFTNSTFINLGVTPKSIIDISGQQAHPNTWGHMDNASYEAAKKLFFCKATTQIGSSGYSVAFPASGTNTNQVEKDESAGALTNQYKIDGVKVELYTHEGDNQPYYRSLSKNSENLYVNYFAYGNLFSKDMGTVMNDFYGGLNGSSSSIGTGTSAHDATPTILITHWIKQ
ncbi:MAG: hypothetical protein K6B69_13670 [Lachnospiraceae bacterium]|nr:hypothetical protein [Lachnospiraceae bacterium]